MNISVLGLVLGLLLLALPIYIIYAFDLRLMRRLLKSLAMMAVMVSAFGAITALLMTCNILWVNLLVGVALALLSSVVVVLRSGLRQRRLLLPVMAASVAPLLTSNAGGDAAKAAEVNSVGILLGMVMMVAAYALTGALAA